MSSFTKFVCISNPYEHAPSTELLTTLGLSSSRGYDEQIGEYGSGVKNSFALFARKGILEHTKLCMGLEVFTFKLETKTVNDASGRRFQVQKIIMKQQNGSTYDLNMSTDFGCADWDDVTMGVREFISNAIDGANLYNNSTGKNSGRAEITFVSAIGRKCRAKDGEVRVFIPLTDEIETYIDNVKENFICLRETYDKNKIVLNNIGNDEVKIYKKGVKVGEFGKSLFDYNIEDISIDESRNVDQYSALRACSRALFQHGSIDQLELFFRRIVIDGDTDKWESDFSYNNFLMSNYYLGETKKLEITNKIASAIKRAVGDVVLVDDESGVVAQQVISKGHRVRKSPKGGFKEVLRNHGVKTELDILSDKEIRGEVEADVSNLAYNCLRDVWNMLERIKMTNDKEMPNLKGFAQTIEGGMDGFTYLDKECKTVYVKADIMDSKSQLNHVLLHECAHYITGATDFSPTFQEFAFKVAAKLMEVDA